MSTISETEVVGDGRLLPGIAGSAGMGRNGPTRLPSLVVVADQSPLTEVFHRINRLIPESQELETISPSTPVSRAIRLMQQQRFSQLPVVEGDEVLGVFSFRSFSTQLMAMNESKHDFDTILVDEFIEPLQFLHVFDEWESAFQHLDRDDAVLIGQPNRLQGIVTAMDVLKGLYDVAAPFVLLGEIELAIRGLIAACVDEVELRECVDNSLGGPNGDSDLRYKLEDMHFNDYVQIIGNGRNWARFQSVFGGAGDANRRRTRTKLVEIRDLRNDVFHFRRELKSEERAKLVRHRNWLLMKARSLEARRTGDNYGRERS